MKKQLGGKAMVKENSVSVGQTVIPMDLRDKCPKCRKGKLDVGIKTWDETQHKWIFVFKCDNPECGYSYQQ